MRKRIPFPEEKVAGIINYLTVD